MRFISARDQAYGVPMIHAERSDDYDIHVGCKRVARFMRADSLRGATLRKYIVTTVSDAHATQLADLVQRRFYAERRNRLWVADFKFILAFNGFVYLAIVLHVYSRKVVGWALENHLRTALVLAAINMAIMMRGPKDVIHQSDHGCQYTNYVFGKRCRNSREWNLLLEVRAQHREATHGLLASKRRQFRQGRRLRFSQRFSARHLLLSARPDCVC